MTLMTLYAMRWTLVLILFSAVAPAAAKAQVQVPVLAKDVRDCRFIPVGPDRTPVQQFLRVSLIARDGITDEKLSGKQRKAMELILAEWHQQLVLAPPQAFTDTSTPTAQLFQHTTSSEATPDPNAVYPMAPNVVSNVEAVLMADGSVRDGVVKERSQWPQSDSMLRVALLQHIPSPAFVIAARALTKDTVAIRVLTSVDPGVSARGVQVSLHMLRLPIFAGTPVTLHPENSGGPLYPEEMRRKGIPGSVLLQFYVSARGYAEQETIHVVKASDGRFVAAVKTGVSGMRFRPATVDGCAVRQLVQQPFSFGIR